MTTTDDMQIETLWYDNGDPSWLIHKGHISAEEFIQAFEAWYEHDDWEGLEIKPEDVLHAIVRNIPTPPQRKDDWDFPYRVEFSKPGRGAYKITYVEIY